MDLMTMLVVQKYSDVAHRRSHLGFVNFACEVNRFNLRAGPFRKKDDQYGHC